jgi:hypothetical protein
MKLVTRFVVLIFWLLVLSSAANSAVVVNEVMSNEPGGYTTLEWIELYNNSTSSVDLSFYLLHVGATQILLGGTMAAQSYMIVCRRLYSSGTTPGFEEYWGNNTGVWGDSPLEQYPVTEASFSLTNSAGNVQLFRAGLLESELAWTEAGADGVSWERGGAHGEIIGQSVDPSGSTPGRLNSLTPLPNDLALDSVDVSADNGEAIMTFLIKNIGLTTQTGRVFTVYRTNPLDTSDHSDIVFEDSLPPADTGIVTVIRRTLSFPGAYDYLGATVDSDDRNYNNGRRFTAPGSEFPPVVLSEIMAHTSGALTGEWIEVKNRYDSAISLDDWMIGDRSSFDSIAPPAVLAAGQYLVLAQDSTAFRQYYTAFTGELLQITHWPLLNNTGDTVRLLDRFGLMADSFRYIRTYDSNYTWSRGEDPGRTNDWGRSVEPGGTPGERNDVVFEPDANELTMTITPNVFSPNGDGIDEVARIYVNAPSASAYNLRIFDRLGREVRTLVKDQVYLRDFYEWDGRTAGGDRLPVGIYIVYFEASGVQSIKKTVVIAR